MSAPSPEFPDSLVDTLRLDSSRSRCVLLAALGTVGAISFIAGWHYRGEVSSRSEQSRRKLGEEIIIHSVAANNEAKLWDDKSPLGEILVKSAGGARIAAIAKLIENTPVFELGDLIDEARLCPSPESRQLVYDLAYAKWVTANSAGALAHATLVAARLDKPDQLPGLFTTWGRIDPHAALAAAQNLKQASFQSVALQSVFGSWAQSDDPLGAVAAVKSLPGGLATSDLLQTVFRKWSEVDPSAAWASLGKIGDVPSRQTVQATIIGNMVVSDPDQAVQLIQDLPDGSARPALVDLIAKKWADADPPAAFTWAITLDDVSLRTDAVQAVVLAWAETDPEAAISALNSAEIPAASLANIREKIQRNPTNPQH